MITVELLDKMGSDLSVVNAARVSYEVEHLEFEKGDKGLIKYLAKHGHWTPFGHTGATFRIKAPIFVARQLVKHQVGLVWNEVSRRYVSSPPEFYYPERWRKFGGDSKQGSLQDEFVEKIEGDADPDFALKLICELAKDIYDDMLLADIAPEQARILLPLNAMTEWWWTGNVASFARVCKLRCASDTQKETRDVANMIDKEMINLFPVSWKALLDN